MTDTMQYNIVEDNLILEAQRETQIARPAEKRVHSSRVPAKSETGSPHSVNYHRMSFI